MLPVWVAVSWMIGIISADSIYTLLHIQQPIDTQRVIFVDILHKDVPIEHVLSFLSWAYGAIALAGAALMVLGRRTSHPALGSPSHHTARSSALFLAGLCILAAATGALRYHAVQVEETPQSVWRLAEQGDVVVLGSVASDPKRDEEGQQVIIQTKAVMVPEAGSSPIDVTGKVLLKLPPYPAYHYGQRLMVYGEIRHPPPARKPGSFDYQAYLSRQRIFALMHEPQVQVARGHTGNPILISLLAFRDQCKTVVLRLLPEPQSSVAAGILLGLKASIPDEIYTTFSIVGTTHILVISGWHLTIVASVFAAVVERLHLGRGLTFFILLAAVWGYTAFVGMGASVLRAAVMASLAVLARTTERTTVSWILLMTACLVLSFLNPHMLWDIGFQLSVLATASLFAFASPVQQWVQHMLHTEFWQTHGISLRWLTEPLGVTLAAQILALPIILYHFGNLSIVSPLANVILVPVLPYAMMFGAIALALGLVWLPLGQVFAALFAWLPLAWLTEGATFLASLPWAAVTLPPIPLWLILSYYGIVLGWWGWTQWATSSKDG